MTQKERQQATFDKVWDWFIVQRNPPSIAEERTACGQVFCRYRGKDGAKCAFGIFIPDEDYTVSMEGLSVMGVFEQHLMDHRGGRVFLDGLGGLEFMRDLQGCHDRAANCDSLEYFHEDIEARLVKLALKNGLTVLGANHAA